MQTTMDDKQIQCLDDRDDATLEYLWRRFYRTACLHARHHDLAGSLRCYIDTFLIRGKEIDCIDRNWIEFFRHQFAIYLLGKKRLCCSLSEGDMIHDFIKAEYETIRENLLASDFPYCPRDLDGILASFELDFPWILCENDEDWSID